MCWLDVTSERTKENGEAVGALRKEAVRQELAAKRLARDSVTDVRLRH